MDLSFGFLDGNEGAAVAMEEIQELHKIAELDDNYYDKPVEERTERITKARKDGEEIWRRMRAGSLTGATEELQVQKWDEFETSQLKYLMLPYQIGYFQQRPESSTRETRLAALKKSHILFSDFLELTMKIGVVEEGAAAPRRTREDHIEAHKKEKELKERMAVYDKRRKGARTIGLETGTSDVDGDAWEEAERPYQKACLRFYANQARGHLLSLDREISLLELTQEQKEEGVADWRAKQESRGKAAGPAPEVRKLSKQDVELLHKSMLDQVQKVTQEAFTPKNLPTMTIEEYAQTEEGMREFGGLQGGGPKPPQDEHDSDEDQEDKEALEADEGEIFRKQEAHDVWKETHPTGWGNRHNKG